MIEGQRSEDHQAYMTEAQRALDDARKKLGWDSKNTNQLIYSVFSQWPKTKELIKKSYGYDGIFLNNISQRIPDQSIWVSTQERFLP